MSKAASCVVLVLACLVLSHSARADSLALGHVSALQANGFTSVDLFANPGITLSPSSTSPGLKTSLTFRVPFSGNAGSVTFSAIVITSTLLGASSSQTFLVPAGTYQSGTSVLFTFINPKGIWKPLPMTLTVALYQGKQLMGSDSYAFRFVEPVPEPATLFLFGTGLAGVAMWRRFRKT
jgi:PEP-CTERM motif